MFSYTTDCLEQAGICSDPWLHDMQSTLPQGVASPIDVGSRLFTEDPARSITLTPNPVIGSNLRNTSLRMTASSPLPVCSVKRTVFFFTLFTDFRFNLGPPFLLLGLAEYRSSFGFFLYHVVLARSLFLVLWVLLSNPVLLSLLPSNKHLFFRLPNPLIPFTIDFRACS